MFAGNNSTITNSRARNNARKSAANRVIRKIRITADTRISPQPELMNDITLIQNKIYEIRGQRVMLDFDLVALYQVTTSAMNQAVKRNAERFPEEFMFRISASEWEHISSQFVTTSRTKRPKSSLPLAFTE